jgi:1-acyl-sn-glycerol-3-phosphate acyltransferase
LKAWLQCPLRVTGRLFWIAGEALVAALSYAIHCAFRHRDSLPPARAVWLHNLSRRMLRILGAETRVAGAIPSSGLLVCNHLSYVDVLVLAALTPCVFVAKHEVKHWPVFGWFARLAGTVFVDRERRAQVLQAANGIETALRSGALVVLFPEGTSSGDGTILPFKSSLLEPAARQMHPLAVALIQYELDDGDVSEEVCYWKDMTLVPHLINLLSKRGIRASVRFAEPREGSADRKELARQLRAQIVRLKESLS